MLCCAGVAGLADKSCTVAAAAPIALPVTDWAHWLAWTGARSRLGWSMTVRETVMPLVAAVFAGHAVAAEVLQQQPERGAGVLAVGQHRQAEDGQVGLVVAPGAVEGPARASKTSPQRPSKPLAAVSWRTSSARLVLLAVLPGLGGLAEQQEA
jgi:hypothetical protein